MHEHVLATALRLNEAVSFCWIDHLTVPVATARSIECCPGQMAGRGNLALRVSCRRRPLMALSGPSTTYRSMSAFGVKRTSLRPVALFGRVASRGSGPTLSGAEERRSAEDRPKRGSHRPRLIIIYIDLVSRRIDMAQLFCGPFPWPIFASCCGVSVTRAVGRGTRLPPSSNPAVRPLRSVRRVILAGRMN